MCGRECMDMIDTKKYIGGDDVSTASDGLLYRYKYTALRGSYVNNIPKHRLALVE